jgi:TRAP-type C4-dicarboxylate transport system permease small subunit
MQDNASNVRSTPIARAIDRLAGGAIAIAASALIGLVVVQGWQVIARYVLNDSPSWTEPVTLLLLSTAMSFSAAAGVRTRRHFSFALLADAVGPALRRALHGLQSLTVLLIGSMLAYWGTRLFVDGLHIPTAGIAMPESIDYLPIAIGGALMVIFALAQLLPGADANAPAALATAETD